MQAQCTSIFIMRSFTVRIITVRHLLKASILALLMTTALTTTAFAKASPTDTGFPTMVAIPPDGTVIDAATGVVVVATDVEGPASQAGIVRGDILLRVNETEINSAAALFEALSAARPGDELTVFLHHGDEPRTLSVVLTERGERAYLGVQVMDPPLLAAEAIATEVITAEAGIMQNSEVAPAAVPPVDAQVVTKTKNIVIHITEPVSGVAVAEVLAGSPAANAGLVAGDLIVAIDGVRVTQPEELIAELNTHQPNDEVTLTVQRGGPTGAEEEVGITLGAASDDPKQPYLGIRYVTMPMPLEGGPFTMPAMPTLPACPPAISYGAVPALPMLPGTDVLYSAPLPRVFLYRQNAQADSMPQGMEGNVIIYRSDPGLPAAPAQLFNVQPELLFPPIGEERITVPAIVDDWL